MSPTPAPARCKVSSVDGADEVFTPDFIEVLVALHDELTPRVHALRERRARVRRAALVDGQAPGYLAPSAATTTTWFVPPLPAELREPGIEISGPCSITSMFVNALNPGPEGERAVGDLDDDEDSAGHRLVDTVRAALNRKAAVCGTLATFDVEKNKKYELAPGKLPFFMHRERSLGLDEPEVTIDGKPVPAALLGTLLTLFHAGREQHARGQGVYFYLPKMESHEEAAWYRDLFDAARRRIPALATATIRAIALIESLPAVYQMEEILYAMGPYAAGLNAARWDLKASIFEYVMCDPRQVWPDRFGVDIKTTPFLANIFKRLVAVCLKHGAVPIGGMATALPSNDPEVNRVAGEAIRADKEWEARQGFVRAWVAHIFHMKTAAEPFRQLAASGWQPAAEMQDPARFPVAIEPPQGPITLDGTRRNARMVIEYLEAWFAGRGAKGIDSLAGRPGIHPALMEDLATGRMSVAQLAQRIRHHVVPTSDPATPHDAALVKQLLQEETDDIVQRLHAAARDEKARAAAAQAEQRYRKACKVAMHWVARYLVLDFRSLGSYTRAELEAIAAGPDAL